MYSGTSTHFFLEQLSILYGKITSEAEKVLVRAWYWEFNMRKDWCPESFSLKNFLVYAKCTVEQNITDHDGLKRKHFLHCCLIFSNRFDGHTSGTHVQLWILNGWNQSLACQLDAKDPAFDLSEPFISSGFHPKAKKVVFLLAAFLLQTPFLSTWGNNCSFQKDASMLSSAQSCYVYKWSAGRIN